MKITQRLTVFAIAVFAATNVSAQETITPSADDDNRDQFGFGIKAGLNIANIYDEENNDYVAESKPGFFAGAFVSAPLGTLFGLQPEINYSQKGFKSSGTFADDTLLETDYEFERTASYLDIPVLVQIKPTKFLTFLVGPQYSYLLDVKDDLDFGDASIENEQELDDDDYKRNMFGIVVGAEANYKGFFFTARGGFDLTKTESDGDIDDSPRYKNQVIQFGLGYTFY